MRLLLMLALLGLGWTATACSTVKCAHGDYAHADCRVAAENHFARVVTSHGVELRFQTADAAAEYDASSWEALGLLTELDGGRVRVRPAVLGDWALSVDPGALGATELELLVGNLAADVELTFGPEGGEQALPQPTEPGLQRLLSLPLTGERAWLRASRPCPPAYRLAVTADVQTNPLQFERLLMQLHDEIADGEASGEPLLGMLVLGDLVERPQPEEFQRIVEALRLAPVPVAVVPGNHDVHGDEYAIYNRFFGPGNYAFDVCRTHVALVDTGGGDLADSIEARLPELIDPGTMDFLLGGTHYPAYPERTGAGWGDEDQAWHWLTELTRQGADLSLAGHVHYWKEMPDLPIGDGSITQIISGTAGATQGLGQPHFGWTRLSFTGALDSCFVEVPEPGRSAEDRGASANLIRWCEE